MTHYKTKYLPLDEEKPLPEKTFFSDFVKSIALGGLVLAAYAGSKILKESEAHYQENKRHIEFQNRGTEKPVPKSISYPQPK